MFLVAPEYGALAPDFRAFTHTIVVTAELALRLLRQIGLDAPGGLGCEAKSRLIINPAHGFDGPLDQIGIERAESLLARNLAAILPVDDPFEACRHMLGRQQSLESRD